MMYRVQRLNRVSGNWVNGAAFKTELEARINATERSQRYAGTVNSGTVLRVVAEETTQTEVFCINPPPQVCEFTETTTSMRQPCIRRCTKMYGHSGSHNLSSWSLI